MKKPDFSKISALAHYHPLVSVELFKKYLIITLVPLVRALVLFELEALFDALRQQALLLCALGIYASLRWYFSGWKVDENSVLHLQDGLFFRKKQSVSPQKFSAVVMEQSPYMRIFGAAKVSLFFTEKVFAKKLVITLPRNSAQKLVEQIFPLCAEKSGEVKFYQASFKQQILFGLLADNILGTGFLFFILAYNLRLVGTWAQDLALLPLEETVKFLAQILPSAMAALFGVVTFFAVLSFSVSLTRKAKYKMFRSANIIAWESGIVRKTHCRVRSEKISCYTVAKTPLSRFLRNYPFYISAGTFKGKIYPLFILSKKTRNVIIDFFPEYQKPLKLHETIKNRTLVPFFALSGGMTALFALLTLGALRANTGFALPLLCVCLFFLCMVCISAEGFFRESVMWQDERIHALYLWLFTIKYVCYLELPSARVRKSLFYWSNKRVNIYLYSLGGQRRKIHSILYENCPEPYKCDS